jgi:hypothetical protein
VQIPDGHSRWDYYNTATEYDLICFLSSPSPNVIVFIALHLEQLAPKSVIFQKAWGVKQIDSLHSLRVVTTVGGNIQIVLYQ